VVEHVYCGYQVQLVCCFLQGHLHNRQGLENQLMLDSRTPVVRMQYSWSVVFCTSKYTPCNSSWSEKKKHVLK
jgi:hypothetical protein